MAREVWFFEQMRTLQGVATARCLGLSIEPELWMISSLATLFLPCTQTNIVSRRIRPGITGSPREICHSFIFVLEKLGESYFLHQDESQGEEREDFQRAILLPHIVFIKIPSLSIAFLSEPL
jgi:hypothetical protein